MAQLRPATAADSAAIWRLIRAEGLDPTSVKWQHFLVAEADGQVVGIGQVKPLPSCREVGSLAVVPAYRGRGIGAQLMRALEGRGGRPLHLLCPANMVPYYERFGYARIAWRRAPAILKLKLVPALLLRPFGIDIAVMVKAG